VLLAGEVRVGRKSRGHVAGLSSLNSTAFQKRTSYSAPARSMHRLANVSAAEDSCRIIPAAVGASRLPQQSVQVHGVSASHAVASATSIRKPESLVTIGSHQCSLQTGILKLASDSSDAAY
jgi:hypothetical protein